MNKIIILDKLFPRPPDNIYSNLMIDYEAVSYITTPDTAEVIVNIIVSHLPYNKSKRKVTIFDGTACVGGDTIAFGQNFGTVIATEIKKDRYVMLINNLKKFRLYNVIPINDDCLNIYDKINYIDIMYFDPPWGGRSYKYKENIRLKIGNMYIDDIINNIINGHVRSNVQMIIFKLPKNYDLYDLYDKTKSNNVIIYLYELNKMNILIYKKKDSS